MGTAITSVIRGVRNARSTLLLAFAILTLTMTLATVTFSIVDGVALRPLPYASPRALIAITTPGIRPGSSAGIAPAEYFALTERTQALTGIAASRPTTPISIETANGREALATRLATTNLFEVLGIKAAMGRTFTEGDERDGGITPAIIGYDAWLRRFGSDPGVIGQTITLGTRRVQIVGVLPQGVWHPMELPPAAVYFPYAGTPAERANTRVRALSVVARMRPGVTFEQARADIVRVATTPISVSRLQDQVVGPARRWLYLVLAAVVMVMLIACVNVATLLLARAATRTHEFAVRASLGESRRQLQAGLLLEGMALAAASGIAALLLSTWGLGAATATVPAGLLTRTSTIALNQRVLTASVLMVLGCAVIFSSAPGWLTSRTDLMVVVRSANGFVVGGRPIVRALAAFLVGEVLVVCVLLVATALVVRSFFLVITADLGFEHQNIAAIEFQRDAPANDDERQIASAMLRAHLLDVTRSVPGVSAAAISINAPVPLAGASVRYSIVIPGFGETRDQDLLETRIVTADYFAVMGMQLISGRLFDSTDRAGSPPVMLINDVAAQRFFPGRDPIGEIVTFRGPTTIIGVLRGVHFEGPEAEVRPEMYIPADHERNRLPRDIGSVVFRTSGEPQPVAAAVREAIRPVLGTDPAQPQFIDEWS